MVEVNWPDVTALDRSVVGEIEVVRAGDDGATFCLPRAGSRIRPSGIRGSS